MPSARLSAYIGDMEEFKHEPAATKNDYETAFEGLEFPTSKVAIISKAHDRGGLDREVNEILGKIPEDRDYLELDDLIAAIRDVYEAEQTKSPI